MRDLKNRLTPVIALALAAIATNAVTNGASIDLQGFDSVKFDVLTGVVTDGTLAFEVQHSDDNAAWAAVPDKELIGTEAALAIAAADDNAVKSIGYVGGKRYVRIVMTQAGATTGAVVGVLATKGHPNH